MPTLMHMTYILNIYLPWLFFEKYDRGTLSARTNLKCCDPFQDKEPPKNDPKDVVTLWQKSHKVKSYRKNEKCFFSVLQNPLA